MMTIEPLSPLEYLLLSLPQVRLLVFSGLFGLNNISSSDFDACCGLSPLTRVSKAFFLCLLPTHQGCLGGCPVGYQADKSVVNTAFSKLSVSYTRSHMECFPPLMPPFLYSEVIVFPPALSSMTTSMIVCPPTLSRSALYIKYIDPQRRWGLFVRSAVPKGVYVCTYAGEHISSAEASRRYAQQYDAQVS
ncbi:hypothetical protein EON65_35410 [archaeon]|nr:MAG: hypothetical protein EON65_35410 [archaeon]